MDLRFSLLLIGLLLIALVFGLSRYSNIIEQLLAKFNKFRKRKTTDRQLAPDREARNAPKLGDSSVNDEVQGEPVFDFSDKFDDTPDESRNVLLSSYSDAPHGDELNSSEKEVAQPADPEKNEKSKGSQEQTQEESGPFKSLRQIDYWVKLSPKAPVSQADVFSSLKDWDKIQFPVQLHVLVENASQWVNLTDAQGEANIIDVVASYQLLDKGEPANAEDLNAFTRCVSALGRVLSAEELSMASTEQALEQSIALASFYKAHREPMAVSICSPDGSGLMGKLIETSAKQQGLEFKDGVYVRYKRMGAENIILYRMINGDGAKFKSNMDSASKLESVVFTILPALSLSPSRDAKEMLDAVKAFSSRVKGSIRIPGRDDFHADHLLDLHSQVSKLEIGMKEVGLEPGGQEVQRIFSQV